MSSSPVQHAPAMRALAVAYGLLCHALFGAAVLSMALAFATGLTLGRGPAHGKTALVVNALLILQFPLLHSWLLSSRGRPWLARLAPGSVGRDLSTTVFVISAALQLLLTFWGWSPSGVVLWQAHGVTRVLLLAAGAGAWLLLLKAMADSQLSVQTGYLGWGAVARNRRPVFAPFSTRGLYRHTRHPIYLAFTLILWCGPVWTPDQLALSLCWSVYCVVGAARKEQRLMARQGAAYVAYRAQVPFWLPVPGRSLPASIAG